MSEDWFDKSWRSEARPPAELDARVLAGARRATRRWAVPLAAAAALTVVVALVFAALLASVELDVPPDSERVRANTPPVVLDLPASTSDGTRARRNAPATAPSAPPRPGPCAIPNVLVGPLGGAGRRDPRLPVPRRRTAAGRRGLGWRVRLPRATVGAGFRRDAGRPRRGRPARRLRPLPVRKRTVGPHCGGSRGVVGRVQGRPHESRAREPRAATKGGPYIACAQ